MSAAALKLADRYRARKADDLRRLSELMPPLEAGDPAAIDQARSIAHGLSGVCGAFGEPALGELANAAEELARAPDASHDDLRAAFAHLRAALDESLA